MFRPRDTAPEAMRVQIEVWRRMSDAQRLAAAMELTENVRRMALKGIRASRPEFSEEEAKLALFERMHGKAFVDRVWRRRSLVDA
jgi:hypothetical protein